MKYKHTQISYMMIAISLAVLGLFTWVQVIARNEITSSDSGTDLVTTVAMIMIWLVITSFISLQVSIDGSFLRIKFGYGIFRKKFALQEIQSAETVKNKWYYGWGIRVWFWHKMIIFNVSGFDAVEIKLKNGCTYRIGTDEPERLEKILNENIG